MKSQIQQRLDILGAPAGRADYHGLLETRNHRHFNDLSPREDEVARLICQGMSNKEIAAVLDISPHTVSTHLRRIYGKLGLRSRVQLATRLVGM